jgi:hypothetical protein
LKKPIARLSADAVGGGASVSRSLNRKKATRTVLPSMSAPQNSPTCWRKRHLDSLRQNPASYSAVRSASQTEKCASHDAESSGRQPVSMSSMNWLNESRSALVSPRARSRNRWKMLWNNSAE